MLTETAKDLLNMTERTNLLVDALGEEMTCRVKSIYTQREVNVDRFHKVDVGVVYTTDTDEIILGCFEIKSCESDFKSGYGRNFCGHINYFVVPEWMKEFMLKQYEKGEIREDVGLICTNSETVYEIVRYSHPQSCTRREHKIYDLGLLCIGTSLQMERELQSSYSYFRDSMGSIATKHPLIRNVHDIHDIEDYVYEKKYGLQKWSGGSCISEEHLGELLNRDNPVYKQALARAMMQ